MVQKSVGSVGGAQRTMTFDREGAVGIPVGKAAWEFAGTGGPWRSHRRGHPEGCHGATQWYVMGVWRAH